MSAANHDIQVAIPSEGTHNYDELTPGTYFWGWKKEGPPLFRVFGGYVSLINGNIERDTDNSYFVGKKVWPVPDGSKITINIKNNNPRSK